ncbi:transposase [Sporomusa malonica]|uniref:Transposase IS200 like n=1 Tax=Sporomusa malonica TaxID=112901 RepID=A0A1W2B9W9_9FIRM|nr:transposase [Sporomusa malonica]SMC69765.1 Transposase IS200 like [Sporomusa malonica]
MKNRVKFIDTLKHYKQKCGFNIFAYCLMDNHVHLIIKVNNESLESVMKRIGVSYVYWYNWKYKRSGHLFQDRYKSEVIEDDSYLLSVVRYIHQNPIKANITPVIGEYPWSSYSEYIGHPRIVDTTFVLKILSQDIERAKEIFVDFMNEQGAKFFEVKNKPRLTDEEAKQIVKQVLGIIETSELQTMEKTKRDGYLRQLKASEGVSIRQIARISGLTFNIVVKA